MRTEKTQACFKDGLKHQSMEKWAGLLRRVQFPSQLVTPLNLEIHKLKYISITLKNICEATYLNYFLSYFLSKSQLTAALIIFNELINIAAAQQ